MRHYSQGTTPVQGLSQATLRPTSLTRWQIQPCPSDPFIGFIGSRAFARYDPTENGAILTKPPPTTNNAYVQ
ncbi:hypothetical protein SCLCIDRAFT_1218952 [Scleroderma citrinum Foug A]|uniref:Uncharacterized protein n=1 Tax=Scleroderma citrinum Foug A TaxID=1036808 RepID=A0A0C3DPR1_9AGAM|nr:hypothetical protein SCLCIDRAFT_1218952 [Scleroderma citrinum Foug A]